MTNRTHVVNSSMIYIIYFFKQTNKDIVNNTQIDEMQSTLNKTNNVSDCVYFSDGLLQDKNHDDAVG
jgi:hypothetical protein